MELLEFSPGFARNVKLHSHEPSPTTLGVYCNLYVMICNILVIEWHVRPAARLCLGWGYLAQTQLAPTRML